MSGLVLVGAVASLRDSLKRVSDQADDEAVAVRATRARVRCNHLRVRVLLRMQQGTLPDVPDQVIAALFDASGQVSAVDPDHSPSTNAALAAAEAALLGAERLLEAQAV